MPNLRTKMRTKGKGKFFLHQQHIILSTEERADSKWEVVTTWWKWPLSDFLQHLQLVTTGGCWLPSLIAHWCECGFDCRISPSFWKTSGKQEGLHFPLFLITLDTNMPSALARQCMWAPSGARCFFIVFWFSSNQDISMKWPQLPLHHSADELMSVSRQLH